MKKVLCILLALAAALSLSACSSGSATATPTQAPVAIDLDLSQMSGTIVYSQMYNIMNDPEPYLGKVIREAGWYDAFKNVVTGVVYTACIIPDATACCSQGMEFIWAGDHAYPADYPEPGTGLTVTGRLESYMEDEYMYLHLVDAEVIWEPEEEA